MKQAQSIRSLALDLLIQREREHGDITDLVKGAFAADAAGESARDRAFLKQLTVGTVERLITLDALIDRLASAPVRSQKPTVRNALRMGAYQILYMDGVADHAAVDESVQLVKTRLSVKPAGFVNAILRRIVRERERFLQEIDEADPPVRYSLPPYLWELFEKERGRAQAERICASFFVPRDLTIRPDPRLLKDAERYDEWERALAQAVPGLRHHPMLPQFLQLPDPGDLCRLPGYAEGCFTVQDAAGALAVAAAGIRPEDRVLDVCAAPGGKSLYAAALLNDPSQLLARDVSEEKCARLRENAERMRLSGMQIEVFDATLFDYSAVEGYDVVLCDLPCSGYGVLGRKPEIRYRAGEAQTESLVRLQRDILSNAARYVRPGGTLIYSTCTVSRAENEDNAAWLASEYPYRLTDWMDAELPGSIRGAVRDGCLQILPGEQESDGFFIARFRRTE